MENENFKNQDVDPQLTLSVQNPDVLTCLADFYTEQSEENFIRLRDALMEARVLVAATWQQNGEKMVPMPALFGKKEGEQTLQFLWVFTDAAQIPKEKMQITHILNLPFAELVKVVSESGGAISGIAINPLTNGITLSKDSLMGRNAAEEHRMNPELEKALYAFSNSPSKEHMKELIAQLLAAPVLTLIRFREMNGKKIPSQAFIKDAQGHVMLPVYTDKGYLPKNGESPAMTLPFTEVIRIAAKVVAQDPAFYGVVINPSASSICLAPKMVRAIVAHPEDVEAIMEGFLQN